VAVSLKSVVRTMSSNSLAPCPDCGHLVSQLAETCPSCARPLRKPAPREGLFLRTLNVGVAVVIGVILFIAIVPVLIGFTSAFLARLVQWLR
jgi:hypothetical protein